MALSVQHPGQIVPDLEEITTVGLTDELTAWLKSADHLFYTWHWSVPPLGLPPPRAVPRRLSLTACVCESYGCKMDEDIEAATAFSKEFGDMPQLLTE